MFKCTAVSQPRCVFRSKGLLFFSLSFERHYIQRSMADSTHQKASSLEKGEAMSKVLSADVSPSPPQPDFPTDAHLGRGEIEVIRIRQGNAVLRKLKAAEEWMDRKLGVESTGAERVREDQRRPPHILNVTLIVFAFRHTHCRRPCR